MIDSNDFADPSPPNVARDGREYSVEGPVAMEASAHSLALIPAGLEVVPFSDRRRHSGQSGKEALVSAHIHSGAETCESALQYDPPPRLERQRIKRKRLFRLRYGLYCAFFLLLILSIALGVGLGVGLGSGHSRSHSAISTTSPESTNFTQHFGETRIGGSIHGSYYSTNGAWNGTAFATSQQGLSGTAPHQPVLYFQHHSGDVRWMELMSDGSWTGGSSLETVANDAKNNTPISAVTWTSKGVNHTHIFYIDVGNTIKEFTRGSDSDEWRDGTIGEAALHPTNVDLVSMQACLADPDAPAIRLWYASSPSTYEEYLWRLDNGGWTYQQQWQGYSGVAGIACRILLENTMSYVAFVNTNSNVEVWYERVRDMSTKGVAGWTKTNISINEVSPTTSLVHTDLFYVESADSNHIHAYNITCYSDERGTTIGHVDAFALEGKHRVANSRFTATSTWGSEGEGTILFFEQDIGNDIAQSRRIMSRENADWTSVSMEIPKL